MTGVFLRGGGAPLVYFWIMDGVFNRVPLFKQASAPLAFTRKCILPLRLSFICFSIRLKHDSGVFQVKWVFKCTDVLDSNISAILTMID